jgi:hypothetical protein
VLRRVVLVAVIVLSSASCSGKSDKGGLTPVSGTPANPLAALVVAPPSGFERSTDIDAHNGTLTPEQFNTYIGEADASAKVHVVRAYQATYDSVGNADSSILIVLVDLKADADAARFMNLSRHPGLFKSSRADPLVRPKVGGLSGVPGGTLIDPTKRDDRGPFDHAAVAARGTHVMFIDLITPKPGRFPVLGELAKKQYERL